jgi:membrane fusion protein, multidrug efflux system
MYTTTERRPRRLGALLALAFLATAPAWAQMPGAGPPAVGVTPAKRQPITQATEYTGRIMATNRVNLVARVSAFIDEVLFKDGAEVKKGDLLYRLEQGPFRADLQAKQALVDQFKAQLLNAQAVLGRSQTLLKGPAGQQSAVDVALANEQALQAQVLGAEAQLQQAQINLDYTEIRAPIDGKIGRTAVTPGNYVSPGTGTLVSIVSQDPMFVVFPVPTRTAIDLQSKSAEKRADDLLIRIRLPDGKIYDHVGALDFVDNTVGGNTDTMILRGIIANPRLTRFRGGIRALVDGELVTVILEDTEKTEAIAIPRAAVLSDQEGDYVYVVGADNKAMQRRIKLGQSTPPYAAVLSGLTEGENVIVDGIQRVRPGQVVSPGPASAQLPTPAPGSPAPAPAPAAPAPAAPAPAASPPASGSR